MKTIHSSLLLVTALAFGLFVHAASASTATWNAASGNWSNALNWSPTIDPNSTSFDVISNNGGSLTLDSSRTVGTYSQTGGTFAIIDVKSLILNTSGSLAGGGVMNLGYSYLYQNAAGAVFTVTNGTIQGFGEIGLNGLSLVTQANGIISANTSGQILSLNGSGIFTNNGLMRAMNGGQLRFNGSANVANNATIRSENASDVAINNRIIGGTLDNASSTGTITLNTGTLRDATISAGSTVNNASNGHLENTLVNDGTVTSFGGQSLLLTANTTLSGGGAIQLGNGFFYDSTGTGLTLTNTDNTLKGYGQIGLNNMNLVNGAAGTVQADVNGQTLSLNGSGTFTNNGRFVARNGGTLLQSAGAFANFSGTTLTGGAYEVYANSLFRFVSANIVTNAASIRLDGVGSNIQNTSGTNALANFATNQGMFMVANDRQFSTPGSLSNAGTLAIGPGTSSVTVNGDYGQGINSTFHVLLGADNPPGFYQLNATGNANLAGTLRVVRANNYMPGPNQTFVIVNAAARNSQFANVIGATVTYTPTQVIIHPTGMQLLSAKSRKTHGGAGDFDIDLPLTGTPGVECRSVGGNYQLVFTFDSPPVSGNANVTAGAGTVSGTPAFTANKMTVNLTGVSNAQTVTVALNNVTDDLGQVLPNSSVNVAFLVGDTTGNGTVSASDVSQTKLQSGQPVTSTNFRTDVNANGSINGTDVSLVKLKTGTALP